MLEEAILSGKITLHTSGPFTLAAHRFLLTPANVTFEKGWPCHLRDFCGALVYRYLLNNATNSLLFGGFLLMEYQTKE